MIRESPVLVDVQNPSIHILDISEISKLFSRCDKMYVDIAKKELAEGAMILQLYHPDFLLKSSSGDLSDINFLNFCIKDVLKSIFPSSNYYEDYWIIRYPLIPEDPMVYIVVKNHSS